MRDNIDVKKPASPEPTGINGGRMKVFAKPMQSSTGNPRCVIVRLSTARRKDELASAHSSCARSVLIVGFLAAAVNRVSYGQKELFSPAMPGKVTCTIEGSEPFSEASKCGHAVLKSAPSFAKLTTSWPSSVSCAANQSTSVARDPRSTASCGVRKNSD